MSEAGPVSRPAGSGVAGAARAGRNADQSFL